MEVRFENGITMLKDKIHAKKMSQLTSVDATFLMLQEINEKLEVQNELLMISNSKAQETKKELVQVDKIEASLPEVHRKWWQKN